MAKKNNVSQPQLSEDIIKNIENYGNEIKTLEDFVKVVRQNPGYHLGAKGNKGLKNMAREIWQNSFDELDKPSSPCNLVEIWFDQRTYEFTCIDNGRGIPFGEMFRVFTDPNTSSNYEKKPYEYSSGLHGVGAKVTNAMSHKFKVTSYKYTGEAREIELTEGFPDYPKEKVVPNPNKFQGTRLSFIPSIDALGEISITWRDVYNWLVNIVPLCSIGAKVIFKAWDDKGQEHTENIVNTDGIMSYLIRATQNPLIAPIIMQKDTGYMKLDIAVTWDTEAVNDTIIAFSNKCPTTMGTHIDGFDAGITQFFTNYMNKIYLASQKKNKISIIPNDIRSGIKAVVSVAHLTPIFDGQSKEKLSNADMEPFVRDSIKELLDQWAKANAKDMAKLCKYFKDVADIRLSVDKQRIRLTDKYDKSKLTGLPAKYVAPTGGGKNGELFICEGDSAAGLIKNNRINTIQGYFPIRGKLPNAFTHSRDKFLANAEVAGIIQIIGGGYGKSFDLSKVKWDKIIFCTDADPDGNHIKALLLRFFILYMPKLIEAGKVYATMPPLYGVKTGKNTYSYLRDRMEYVQYIQRNFSKNNTVSLVTAKNPLSPKELSKVLYKNIDYTYELKRVADNYAIEPILLESILILLENKTPKAKFISSIKKQFRFIDTIDFRKDVIIVEGLVNSKINTVFVNDALLNDCKAVLEILKSNEQFAYKINGNVVSIYELMTLFDKSAPSRIQRYKGLTANQHI